MGKQIVEGHVIPRLQRRHRGAGLVGMQIMGDMPFHGSGGATEELD